MRILDANGRRLYLTESERRAFMEAATHGPRQVRSFCSVLHCTGCRISEALALTFQSIDLGSKTINFRSLKKRNVMVFREVPIPPDLIDTLDMVHGIREAKSKGKPHTTRRLWPWTRMTAWRKVRAVFIAAKIENGPHATPKGLRHGFGVAAIGKGISLNMLQKWLGHAHLSTTAIYTNASGEEERKIASRMLG